MEERMDENLVKIYYLSSLYRPRIHFTIGSIYSRGAESLQWDQYVMKKSQCRTDAYEQEFLLESDQYLEFVLCSDHEDDSKVSWENPRGDCKQKFTKGNNFYVNKTGVYAIYQGYIVPVNQQKVYDRIVIFTDIDGTLYGKPQIHEDFKRYFISNGLFCNPLVTLIYSTGRGLEKFKDILFSGHLLYPDILVASCGTEVYHLGKSQSDLEHNPFFLDKDWVSYITQDNWNKQALFEFIQQEFPAAQHNHPEGECKYKGSFLLTEKDARKRDLLDIIMKKAANQLKSNWKYVISGCGTHRFLDIMPERADKGSSLQFVCMKILKIDYIKSVAFGDSLNDVDLLVSAGRGYIVGNAQQDLLDWHLENAKRFPNIQCSPYEEADAIVKYLEKLFRDYHK